MDRKDQTKGTWRNIWLLFGALILLFLAVVVQLTPFVRATGRATGGDWCCGSPEQCLHEEIRCERFLMIRKELDRSRLSTGRWRRCMACACADSRSAWASGQERIISARREPGSWAELMGARRALSATCGARPEDKLAATWGVAGFLLDGDEQARETFP